MLDPVLEHPPDRDSVVSDALMPRATAGQRAAADALGEAVAERQPLILLFGDAGVGKTTLINSFLASLDRKNFSVVHLSATSGEFVGPPSFDLLLDIVCRQLVGSRPTGQRPATLALLAANIGLLAREGSTVLLAIDHADHLTNNVMAEVIRLGEYLDAPPAGFVCIFIGSPTLASRLDVAIRRPQRITEIRVSHPSGNELAALLAYEDTAQPGGPILTPGAIDRISAYAKANLHWAAPLADAARTLAANQGEREVTPELVRGALLELWPPEQPAQSDTTHPTSNAVASASNRDSVTMVPQGMSDLPLGSSYSDDAGAMSASSSAVGPDCSANPSLESIIEPTSGGTVSWTISIRRSEALPIILVAAFLLLIIGAVALTPREVPDQIGQTPPASERTEAYLPGPQGESEARHPGEQENGIHKMPPAEPPFGTEPPKPSDIDPGEKGNSLGNQPADATPTPQNIAPTTQPAPNAPAPATRAPTTKKAMAPKAPTQDRKHMPSHSWVQTR